MKTEMAYTVELAGPGLSLKKELPETIAHELLVWLLKGGRLQPHLPLATASQPPHTEDRPASALQPGDTPSPSVVSVREFMEQHTPGRLPDKIACFGLYLREHRNQKEFSKEDLAGLFEEAAEPLPKNLTRDIRWAQQIAWIAPSTSNPNAYYLTKKGEDAVRASFPREAIKRTRFSSPTRRRNGTSSDKPEVRSQNGLQEA